MRASIHLRGGRAAGAPDEVGLTFGHVITQAWTASVRRRRVAADLSTSLRQVVAILERGGGSGQAQGIAVIRILDLHGPGNDLRACDQIPEPEAGQAVPLAEGAGDDDVRVAGDQTYAVGRSEVGISLVDHERALEPLGKPGHLIRRTCGARRAVRVGDECELRPRQGERLGVERPVGSERDLGDAGVLKLRQGSVEDVARCGIDEQIPRPSEARVMIVRRSSEPLPARIISGSTSCNRAAAWRNAGPHRVGISAEPIVQRRGDGLVGPRGGG